MAEDDVLVVDGGSHSLRLVVVSPDQERAWHRYVEAPPDSDEARKLLDAFQTEIGSVAAVGHRAVHGGRRITQARLIDDSVIEALEEAAPMAPLHMPAALHTITLLRACLPDTPQVVAIDTAFHSTMPASSSTYALPRLWRERWDLRRYGFHGLSYASSVPRVASLLEKDPSTLSCVMAHLGGGSSVCAVQDGRSVWTSMGNTPLDGLTMGSRSGSVDPGMLLDLVGRHGLSVEAVRDGLDHHSGLLGLSNGRSEDTRRLAEAAEEGDAPSQLALDIFCLHAAQAIAAAATCLKGLDAVVFTGEIGSDHPQIREAICQRLHTLGVESGLALTMDQDTFLSPKGVGIPVIALTVGEDLQIAKETRSVVGNGDPVDEST